MNGLLLWPILRSRRPSGVSPWRRNAISARVNHVFHAASGYRSSNGPTSSSRPRVKSQETRVSGAPGCRWD